MSDQYLGEIRPAGFNFAPYGWALCAGQLVSIQQYSALFSLLGTQFGGNGTTNFALPNLQGSVLVGQGTLPSGNTYEMGESAGVAQVTLTQSEMPIHTHAPAANSGGGANTSPANSIWALESDSTGNACAAYAPPPPNVQLPVTLVQPNGGSQPLSVTQPTLVVNYIIALQGIFPQRP
ncbi:Microcystin-dependent protein [Granulicella pectinivorans]|jgi:microcystin-dependent protein|uniref:Microcystin-dependent protein n=1 Tax=Granulicella pectinivorans TaxID=474950 RepID=A0A1I6LV68_9BACT|nr:tail fiber protein [Granulicella pectinivorans]SFS07306.1 Microcystin-dependent protein [Granulicella pectinivorans]